MHRERETYGESVVPTESRRVRRRQPVGPGRCVGCDEATQASRRKFLVGGGVAGLATMTLPSMASAASGESALLSAQGEFATPSNLQATPGDTQVTLSWTAVAGATSYQIQYRQGSSGPYLLGGNTDGTSLTVNSLTNGLSYEFILLATDGGSNVSSPTSPVSATPNLQAPGVPTGLSATPGNSQIIAEWSLPESGGAVATYDVRYSTDSETWTTVTGLSTTSTTITGLTNGTTYYVQVRATNAAGSSAWSASDTAVPVASTATSLSNLPPGPPVNSALTALTTATIFTDKGSDTNRYFYSTDNGETYTEATGVTSAANNSFDVSGLTGSSYTLKVQKRSSNGTTVIGTSTLTLVRQSLTYTSGQVYTITNGSGDTRPTESKFTLVGGGGGKGGADGSGAGGNPSQPGQVVVTRTWGSGEAITLAAGSGGSAGSSNVTNTGGGAGGSNAFSASSYAGGAGAKAGRYGASGAGGGGGAASVVKIDGTVTYVAGGGGGGGGGESRQSGANGDGSTAGSGGSGTNGDAGFVYTGAYDDAAGGGGGGGGAVGGDNGGNTRLTSFSVSCGVFCSNTVYVYGSTASKRGTNQAATGTVDTNGFATGRANGSSGYVTVEYLETTSLVQS